MTRIRTRVASRELGMNYGKNWHRNMWANNPTNCWWIMVGGLLPNGWLSLVRIGAGQALGSGFIRASFHELGSSSTRSLTQLFPMGPGPPNGYSSADFPHDSTPLQHQLATMAQDCRVQLDDLPRPPMNIGATWCNHHSTARNGWWILAGKDTYHATGTSFLSGARGHGVVIINPSWTDFAVFTWKLWIILIGSC